MLLHSCVDISSVAGLTNPVHDDRMLTNMRVIRFCGHQDQRNFRASPLLIMAYADLFFVINGTLM
jgi:hypothetical protein